MIEHIVPVTFVAMFLVVHFSYRAMNRNFHEGKTKAQDGVRTFKYIGGVAKPLAAVSGLAALFGLLPGWLAIATSEPVKLLGLIISALGITIFLLAKAELGSNYSPCHTQYLPHEVVRTGIYAILRHPIYVGTSMLLFGLAIASGCYLTFLCSTLIAVYQWQSARKENAMLNSLSTGA